LKLELMPILFSTIKAVFTEFLKELAMHQSCCVAVGYGNDAGGDYMVFRNSWSTGWGEMVKNVLII